jgi:nucleotide-binding universal stress UspA family protein
MSRCTEDCRKAVHYGISFAKTFGAELSILNIEYDPFDSNWGVMYLSRLGDMEEEYRAMMAKAKKKLDAMIRQEKAQGMAIKEIVKAAEPLHEILKVVKDENIDLLIMAGHNETRIEHIIYGWANHEIIRRLPCSVFLVKGK